ncbi:4267_t:CDS:1, partial [Acaulospora colombiana]
MWARIYHAFSHRPVMFRTSCETMQFQFLRPKPCLSNRITHGLTIVSINALYDA